MVEEIKEEENVAEELNMEYSRLLQCNNFLRKKLSRNYEKFIDLSAVNKKLEMFYAKFKFKTLEDLRNLNE